jgi:hypothetical protein
VHEFVPWGIFGEGKTASDKIFKSKLFGSLIGTPFEPGSSYLLKPFPELRASQVIDESERQPKTCSKSPPVSYL